MSAILVHPPELKKTAQELASHSRTIGQAMQSIENEMNTLRASAFLGNRANAVQVHYRSKRDALLRAKELVSHFSTELERTADRFEAADRSENPGSGQTGTHASSERRDLRSEFERFQPPATVGPDETTKIPAKWIADMLGIDQREVTITEKKLLEELGITGQIRFFQIQQEARMAAETFSGQVGLKDGVGDAFRHAYWNALMVREFGKDWAKNFADAHETFPGNSKEEAFMDLWNNDVGRRIAEQNPDLSKQEIANKVADAVRNGDTVLIDDTSSSLKYTDEPESINDLSNPPVYKGN